VNFTSRVILRATSSSPMPSFTSSTDGISCGKVRSGHPAIGSPGASSGPANSSAVAAAMERSQVSPAYLSAGCLRLSATTQSGSASLCSPWPETRLLPTQVPVLPSSQ
jgi:hypothetical protein